MFKPVPQLYRDCLRTVLHMTGQSAKGRAIAALIRQEFKANKDVTEQAEIDKLKNKSTAAAPQQWPLLLLGAAADRWLSSVSAVCASYPQRNERSG
jgi:hypothetical protein